MIETKNKKPGMVRRLYEWVLSWADSPYGSVALFILAFAESSFFPIPPDVLLIALAISRPKKAFHYALICSVGSVLGGIAGYGIGLFLMDTIGVKIFSAYGLMEKYSYVQALYIKYDAWAVGIAGFTPIPYKLFTIAAGGFKISFPVFVIASTISRSLRFFIVAGLIYLYGQKIKAFLEKYFNLLTILFTVLLIGGFVIIKYLI